MLRTLKDLFDSLKPPAATEPPQQGEHLLQLAAAVLLVEVMRSDTQMDDGERSAVLAALQRKFALAADERERLLELAEQTARDAHDFHSFTSRINEGFDFPQKVRMIEALWEVAYADGQLSAHENHVIRKICDLLHVPQGAYISAKLRVQQAREGKQPIDD
ncbi:hypothetical protein GPROT2_03728 [Gammaproteobacteria bacterium]|nr:hypothetical protein GPROT2_03728 [Gammaproteobacteria bacterium]